MCENAFDSHMLCGCDTREMANDGVNTLVGLRENFEILETERKLVNFMTLLLSRINK